MIAALIGALGSHPPAAAADAAPVISMQGFPDSVIVDSSYSLFTVTINNPGAAIPDARVDVDLTGSSDMTGSEVRLQFLSGIWVGPTLLGNADDQGGMSGYLGQPSGFTLLSGKTTYSMRIAFVAGTPADRLTAAFDLDLLDPATDSAASTLSHAGGRVSVIPKTTPVAPDVNVVATSGVAKNITLDPTDADGFDPRVTHTDPTTGTLIQHGSGGDDLTYTAPSTFIGTDTFTYTASGANSEIQIEDPPSSTGTVTVTVKAPTTLGVKTTPSRPTVGQRAALTVHATSSGAVDGGTVTVSGTGKTLTQTVVGVTAGFTLPPLPAGSHPLTVTYGGTATAQKATATATDTVVRAASRIATALRPAHWTTSTRHPKIAATVTSHAGSVDAGQVSVFDGHKRLGRGVVRSGRATITLPRQAAGRHTWRVTFSGTPTTLPASATVHVNVSRG